MQQGIIDQIKRIAEKQFLIKKPRFTDKQSISKDLGLNPLELLDMLFHVEHTFNISIEDQDIPKIRTVGDLVGCVERYQS